MIQKILLLLLLIHCKVEARIYDCFTFFNELELLAIRLEELDSVVDYFVLVEGTLTFTGEDKLLYFQQNRHLFEPYLHKIIHVVVDDFPFVNPKIHLAKQPWIRETHQRNAILRGLTEAVDDDVVTITDVDEIPRAQALLAAQSWLSVHGPNKIACLEMPMFCYQLNRGPAKWFWTRGFATMKKTFEAKTPHFLRMSGRYDHFIANGGWHFTLQGGAERVLYKLNSDSHAYDGDGEKQRLVMENFDQVVGQYPDVYPVDETWPIRIRRLLPKYDAMGWIAH